MPLLRCDPRPSPTRWACLALFCLLLATYAGRAGADAEPAASEASEPAGYRALIEDGLSEFRVNHYEEARALFGRAHALFPNASTHRALGSAAFELRNYVEAIQHLEAALGSHQRPLDDNLRKQAEGVLARAYGFVGRVQILLLQPASSRLVLDGQAVALPADGVVLMRIGEHTLEAQAHGYAAQKQRIEITGGEKLAMRFNLLPVVEPRVEATRGVAVSAARADQPEGRRVWYKSPWLWAGVGVALAGAVAAVAVAVSHEPAPNDPYRGTSNTIVEAP